MKNHIFLISVVIALSSCTTDVTRHPAAMTDYVVGQHYELKQPAYIWNGRLVPRALYNSGGMLTNGTRLAVRRVQVDRSPEMGTLTDVFAEIVNGESKGKTVNITWVSEVMKTGYTKRDPRMLEPVEIEQR
jgi:hypothetical protein